jgi:hypothetical protein
MRRAIHPALGFVALFFMVAILAAPVYATTYRTLWTLVPLTPLPVGTPIAIATAGGTHMKLTVQTGGTQGVDGGRTDTMGVAETGLAYDSLSFIGIFNGGGFSTVPTSLAFTNIQPCLEHRRGFLMLGAINGLSSPVTVTSSVPGRVATWTVVGHPFDWGPGNSTEVSWDATTGSIMTNAPVGIDSRCIVLDLGNLSTDGDVTISLNQHLNDGILCAFGEEIDETLAVPLSGSPGLALAAPRPNPACAEAALAFDLPAAGRVRLVAFDLSGRRLATLADGMFAAGGHAVRWDLRDSAGARVAAGLVFVRLETAQGALVRRLTVVR